MRDLMTAKYTGGGQIDVIVTMGVPALALAQ
jgi:hypothetical protein